MAEVTIPQQYASVLAQPSVCAKTGAVTNSKAPQRLDYVPGWIWILILFGLFPFLIVYYFTRTVCDVQIPIADAVAEKRFRFRLKTALVLLVSAALAVLGAYKGATLPTVTGIAGLIGVVALAPVIGARLWITASFDGESIHLSRVHPNYVAAIDSARFSSAE